jgi:hypothetical protein
VPRRSLLLAFALSIAVAGCSLKNGSGGSGQIASGVHSNTKQALSQLGLPIAATRDTTRVSGTDPATDAAGVATAVFPSASPATRPKAVALVDKNQWQSGVAAGVLAGPPLNAPILLSDGGSLPGATSSALGLLKPTGQPLAQGIKAILVGDTPPAPGGGIKSGAIRGKDPFTIAAGVDRFQSGVAGRASADVVVVSAEQAAWAMPAGAWAARSGDSVLFVKRNSVPAPTRKALAAHSHPNIYLLGPASVISKAVESQLGKLGSVTRIDHDAGKPVTDPVASAVAFTRFTANGFGWGARVPGRNYSLANTSRPLDAAAAATLASNSVYAPLLVTDSSKKLPPALEGYLLDVQPGFERGDPSAGLYNHVWILGNRDAVSTVMQDRIDQLTALVPVEKPAR